MSTKKKTAKKAPAKKAVKKVATKVAKKAPAKVPAKKAPAKKAAKVPAKKAVAQRDEWSTPKAAKTVKMLADRERTSILHLAASGASLKEVAKNFGIRYASIRHVVFEAWARVYPEHYRLFGSPQTISRLRMNPPHKHRPEPTKKAKAA